MEIKKLFIPGPTYVHPDVLAKMGTPMIGHRTKEASELQRNITRKMQQLMFTENKIVLSTSSGTGLMEGAIRSATQKKAIVFSVGAFGKRWYELARLNGIDADLHEEISGHATLPETVEGYLKTGKYDTVAITHNETSVGIMNPVEAIAVVMKKYPEVVWMLDCVSSLGGAKIEVDRLGVDICITSSQKALALPPGLSIASVSQKAIDRFEKIGPRGYYLDLGTMLKFIEKKDHQYHCTPSLSHMFALDFQLDRIEKEKAENRFIRHIEMAEYMINWANHYFEVYCMPGFESLTVTCIRNTRNINVSELNKQLAERGMLISNGYGELKDKTFRIGHMGDLNLDDVQELTGEMEKILKLD
ncbi:MAG: alanine--glyoxylate aminotransferase family protein [Bacteroidetes bacterium]|nr:alanine--glyoxylate aminotransferase family protein [Bacteroidota bacterium]MBK9525381.1 alanine--glyoxylate aminotransferase family protein [Bacteroidota bacterium]MBK9542347.1 alanine--glyoxylate aminotransferase family protein [Bacteroidota bacterium]MBP6403653.1 alanine--glyoxylate aminotransferase family protein [Bacteroidia bacterium]